MPKIQCKDDSVEPLSGVRQLLYAFGGAGFQLGERIVISIAIYFYLPPSGRGLDPIVSQEIFLGGLTAFGLAMLIGRIFDTVADPLVAQASDSSRSQLGRRRTFLMIGVLPMLAIPVLLFWPPGEPGSQINFWWLTVLLSLYFVFFTVYVAPYLALIPEIARNHKQRVHLATVLALVTVPIVGLYSVAWPWAYDWIRGTGADAPEAIRIVVVVTAVVALILCLMPIFAIDENRHTSTKRSNLTIGQAIRETIVNRPFLLYLGAQVFFIIGINLIHPSIIYYATVVLGRSEGFTGNLGIVMFASTLLSFLVVNPSSSRYGAKRTIIACVVLFSLGLFSLAMLVPGAPGTPQDGRNLLIIFSVMVFMGVPLAGFLVLPHVLISQLIDRDQSMTGASRAAMYFGVQGLFTKLMYAVSTAILAFLFARFGNSADQPQGVLLVGPVAGAFCLVSAFLFAFYPEREVLRKSSSQVEAETQ